MRHFGKIDFLKNEMAHYSAHFHEKFMLKKPIIFAKLKEQNVVRANEFSWFRQESCMYPHMTFLKFRLLFQAPFLLRTFF